MGVLCVCSDHEYEPVNPPPEEPKPSPPQEITHEDVVTIPIGDVLETAPITQTEPRTEAKVTHETPPSPTFTPTLSSRDEPDDEELEDIEAAKESTFQSTFKLKAGQFKNKLQNMKRPHIKTPKFEKPNLQRFKIDKPNLQKLKIDKSKFHLKMPDTTKINLPSFSLPHRSTKTTLKERQESTESNVGDSTKHTFDFKTYPRFFKKKPKDDDKPHQTATTTTTSGETQRSVEAGGMPSGYEGSAESDAHTHEGRKIPFDFSTFPRFFKKQKPEPKTSSSDSQPDQPSPRSKSEDRVIIRIPLHSEDSMENGYSLHKQEEEPEEELEEEHDPSSRVRYDNEDIDIDDDYNRENVEIPDEGFRSRWDHGHFSTKITDLDSPESPESGNNQNESFDLSGNEPHSSHSSLGVRRRGVLEEINSDEFFLRQKGISQDNIEVGKYLSSEIREAFKAPVNTLSDMQREDYGYDPGSNQSLPESPIKKKPVRKPKRKKTPHASQEMKYHEYDLDEPQPVRPQRTTSKPKSLELDEKDIEEIMSRYTTDLIEKPYYENEKMRGKTQPDIYIDHGSEDYRVGYATDIIRDPEAPPRKHRSMKSLNLSEHDSILGDFADKHVSLCFIMSTTCTNTFLSVLDRPRHPILHQRRLRRRKPVQPGALRRRTGDNPASQTQTPWTGQGQTAKLFRSKKHTAGRTAASR